MRAKCLARERPNHRPSVALGALAAGDDRPLQRVMQDLELRYPPPRDCEEVLRRRQELATARSR